MLLLAVSPPTGAADFEVCKTCHSELLEETFRPYLHLPFLQQRCAECHVAKPEDPAAEEESRVTAKTASPSLSSKGNRTSWLRDSVMAATSHGFVLPGGKVASHLVVELQGVDGTFGRQEIALPPLEELSEAKDDARPPQISNVEILKVERGVFLSATVGWETDTLANAQVRYGITDFSQASQPFNRLGRSHEVILYNLKPDSVYRFIVVSRDLFGREQVSKPGMFSTKEPVSAQIPGPAVVPPEQEREPELLSRLERIDGDYLVQLTLLRPARVFVGTTEVASEQESSSLLKGDAKHHGDLAGRETITLKICRDCHKGPATATHPVNVYPKPGMIVPPEYPTLPDGRITCRSCHEPHGSDHEWLSIRRSKRELCIGCHKDMI